MSVTFMMSSKLKNAEKALSSSPVVVLTKFLNVFKACLAC